jgi:hypothetical protein
METIVLTVMVLFVVIFLQTYDITDFIIWSIK